MRPASLFLVLAVLTVTAVLSRPAYARDGIVLESYTGPRPSSAPTTLGPLLSELSARGFVTGEGVGRIYDAKVSRPAGPALPADFIKKLADGRKAFVDGEFDDAVAKLGPLIDAAHASSGAFARNQPLREKLVDALIALAMAQQRGGDPRAARLTFGELARSYPDAQVPKATWGPEAAKLFDDVKRELREQPRGRLVLKVTDETAEVFINERFEQKGTTVKQVLPGDYRVVVQQGAHQSRVHLVTVTAGTDTTVQIELDMDDRVRTGSWTGFQYGSGSEREQSETSDAAAFGAGINERAVVVIGIDDVKGHLAIVGALVSVASGRESRRASLPLDPAPNSEKLAALARFLAGDPAGPGIEVQLDGDATAATATSSAGEPLRPGPPIDRPVQESRRWGGWPLVTGVIALGAIGTGLYYLHKDGTCPDGSNSDNCPNVYNTKTPAIIALSGGALFAVITIYLIVDRPSSPPTKQAFVVPTSGGAMAGYSFAF
ncbi:MAG TPA: tetratricopeptide repeat protein [Kofleriaceae bacterium]